MSNQYKSALSYAKDKFESKLTRYGIDVDLEARTIIYRDGAIKIQPGTTFSECTRIMNQLIKREQRITGQEQQAKQGKLL